MVLSTDILVIGGGIAGVSVGYFLTEAGHRVLLVEGEERLAYHTTGRSAAILYRSYGTTSVRSLTAASLPFLEDPPSALVDVPLVSPRGIVLVARTHQMDRLKAELVRGVDLEMIEPAEVADLVPVIRTARLVAGLLDRHAVDMDVAALHQAFVRGMRRGGATIRTGAPVEALSRSAGRWLVKAGGDLISVPVVVNAAGAWCDIVAGMAGVEPVGLKPMRRTAFMVPGRQEWSGWPAVVDIDQRWYFKPDGEQILCSPAEEKTSEPCDARPEELDIALAIDRINRATTLGIRTVRSAWTGLRSFVSDRSMVIGFDCDAEGFFWLAGQGGTGIQTAPAAGRLAASLITAGEVPRDQFRAGVRAEDFAPGRLRQNPPF